MHSPFLSSAVFLGLALSVAPGGPAAAFLWGDDHPEETQIQEWIAEVLPDHFDIRQVVVENQRMQEQPFEYSVSEVMVTLETQDQLYRPVGTLEDYTPVIEMVADGSAPVVVDLPVTVEALLQDEVWMHNILWDAGVLEDVGEPRSAFSDRALVSGSENLAAHLAALEAAVAAHNASVSGTFAGLMVCHEGVFDIQTLHIDAAEERGTLVSRLATNLDTTWEEVELRIDHPRDDGLFFLSGVPHNDPNIRLTAAPDGSTIPTLDGDCEFHLYPEGDIPDDVVQQRFREANALSRMIPGPIPARLTEDETEREVTVRILDVFERGFRMVIDHPMSQNGNFNRSDEVRAVSTMSVRFVDAPVQTVITGTVDGRGELPIRPRCNAMATALDDGSILLEALGGFKCDERLILMR